MTKDMIMTALDITIMGMGFVIGFLIVFLLITQLMSYLIQKIDNRQTTQSHPPKLTKEAKFIIKNAVEQHIKNV